MRRPKGLLTEGPPMKSYVVPHHIVRLYGVRLADRASSLVVEVVWPTS